MWAWPSVMPGITAPVFALDDPGVGSSEAHDVCLGADGGDPRAPDRHRLGEAEVAVYGDYLGVAENEIGGSWAVRPIKGSFGSVNKEHYKDCCAVERATMNGVR